MRENMNRRQWFKSALLGSSLLALRASASGIPASVLANPVDNLLGLTDDEARSRAAASKAQFLILSATDNGEPMNCNVPGTYGDARILHPTNPAMAPKTFMLGTQTTTAAGVWATLPSTALQQACFFHHATYAFAHGDLHNVYTLQNTVPNQEQLASAIAAANQQALGTIQAQPIALSATGGSETIAAEGIIQPMYSPLAIKSFLSSPDALAALNKTQALRDRDLDTLNGLVRAHGTTAQRNLLDSWATSQKQARSMPQTLLAAINALADNSIQSQLTAATLLFALKLAPAAVVRLTFGGDNHTDNDGHEGPGALPAEGGQHVKSLAAINGLLGQLSSLGLSNSVTLATLTTFGRSNCGTDYVGRAHNGKHTCNLIMGANVRGGVVGGVELVQGNLTATAIDSASGASGAGGDIAYGDTLDAYGATLGAACGLDDATVAAKISPGLKVVSALA